MNEKVDEIAVAESRENFEYWLFYMDDELEKFLSKFEPKIRNQLDYSISSLKILENWILEKYSNIEETRKSSEAENISNIGRYIGKTFRKNIDSLKWSIQLEDSKTVFYGLPILRDTKKKTSPICPLTLGTASVDRRMGNYLTNILKNLIIRY